GCHVEFQKTCEGQRGLVADHVTLIFSTVVEELCEKGHVLFAGGRDESAPGEVEEDVQSHFLLGTFGRFHQSLPYGGIVGLCYLKAEGTLGTPRRAGRSPREGFEPHP